VASLVQRDTDAKDVDAQLERVMQLAQAPEPLVFTFREKRFALAFTYEDMDLLVDEAVFADAVIYPVAYGYAVDDANSALGAALLENRYRMDATALEAWVVGVGSLGAYGNRVFGGASFVLAPWGDLMASAPAFEEALLTCDIDSSSGDAPSEVLEPELYNKPLHLWEALTLGLRGFVEQLQATDVVLAFDGMLHSSLLAALASDALGPTHVHALLVDDDPACVRAARALGEALRIDVREAYGAGRSHGQPDLDVGVLAMAQLASWARELGAVPLSAEDKTYMALEVPLGSCHVASLLPFGDVYRSDVMEMAHMRNTISPIIPVSCFRTFDVPDIEGLAEVEHGPEARLRRIDVTLATHIEWGRTVTDTVARQGVAPITERVLQRYREREAARLGWPPSLVVSSRSLFDARLPMGIRWTDRPRTQDERMRMADVLGSLHGPEGEGPLDSLDLERMGAELSEIFGGAGATLVSGTFPEGVDRASVERSVEDLLGLLRDVMQGGAMSPQDGDLGLDGPFGPLTWGGPFSEN
jgi:NAD+ synthase (glutamine-hydrolysing)